jgi:GDPmannose 4,6-dehydratase
MKRALITGITGQDGSYLADYLLSIDYEVHGLKRVASQDNTKNIDHLIEQKKIFNKNFFLHSGDITDAISLVNILANYKFDEIYHLSAQSHVHASFQMPEYTANINAMGTIKILELLKRFLPECRFYNASTSELYGNATDSALSENSKFSPTSPYAISKLYSHLITKNFRDSYGLFCCSGILFNHESPRRGKTFVTKKITERIARIKLGLEDCLTVGNLNSKRDWGYAPEYVRAMHLMLQQNKPEEFVVGTGKNYSVRYFVEKTFELADIEIAWEGSGINEVGINKKNNKTVVKIDKYFFRPSEVNTLLSDPSKAKKKLNWEAKMCINDLISTMYESGFNSLKK